MINENVIQRQGRIKREMLLQSLARPYDVDMLDAERYEERFMQVIGKKLVSDIDLKTMETNPIYKVSTYGDKVMVKAIPEDKVYLQSGMFSGKKYGEDIFRSLNEDVWKLGDYNSYTEDKPELTLVNGVYE